MTAIELIDETVNYYSQNPVGKRATRVEDGIQIGCEYYTPEGRMCAVGRCCKNPKLVEEQNEGLWATSIPNFESILKKEYQGFPIKLWEELQNLHDTAGYWTETGLSHSGEDKVKELKESYKDVVQQI